MRFSSIIKLMLSGVGILMSSFAVSAAQAQPPKLVWCQNCTPMERQGVLEMQAPYSVVYIADAIQGWVEAYWIVPAGSTILQAVPTDPVGSSSPSRIHPGPVRDVTAMPINEDPDLVSLVHQAMDWYNLVPVGLHKHIQVALEDTPLASQYDSVYDVINAGPNRNHFNDWINANSPVAASLGFVSALEEAFVNGEAVPDVLMTVTFADGSTVNMARN